MHRLIIWANFDLNESANHFKTDIEIQLFVNCFMFAKQIHASLYNIM